MDKAEAILEWIETIGGGYVWEPEIFSITLLDVAVTDEQAQMLLGLPGVQQIALDAALLSQTSLNRVCTIDGLESIVIANSPLSVADITSLRECHPSVEIQLL